MDTLHTSNLNYKYQKENDLDNNFGLMVISLEGEFSPKGFMALPEKILEHCKLEDTYNVLINSIEVNYQSLTTMHRFNLGEKFAEELGGKVNLAIVLRSEYLNKFGETVAVNRGLKGFATDSLEEARNWFVEQ
ncbi:MAG: hypothetical protein AB8B53_12165 [Flavobacteriales bacterium]